MDCEHIKVAFAGTPEFANVALKALVDSQHQVVGVLTQPDRPAGRGRRLTPSPVKLTAMAHGIEVQQPESLKNDAAVQAFQQWHADVLVVAAYGLILPQRVLQTPKLGCLNIHASLLPRWRGAAPIHRAILAGDEETGISIMQMDEGLDTGDVLHSATLAIDADESTAELHDRLAHLGATTLLSTLSDCCLGRISPQPQQDHGVIYAEKLSKSEARLDFENSAISLHRLVRAFNPWPVAEAELAGKRVRIWKSQLPAIRETASNSSIQAGTIVDVTRNALLVKTQDGFIELTLLQWPGKKAQTVMEFSQGHDLKGMQFS